MRVFFENTSPSSQEPFPKTRHHFLFNSLACFREKMMACPLFYYMLMMRLFFSRNCAKSLLLLA
jgi:hypothetical protein